MSKGFIVRYVTRGNFLTGADRWDFASLEEAESVIHHLRLGIGERIYGVGLSEGDCIALFSADKIAPANEIRNVRVNRKMSLQEISERVGPGEKEMRFEEYLNGKWKVMCG